MPSVAGVASTTASWVVDVIAAGVVSVVSLASVEVAGAVSEVVSVVPRVKSVGGV